MTRKQFRNDVVPAKELVRVMEEVVSTISYCNTHTRTKELAKKVRRYGLPEKELGITWRKPNGLGIRYTSHTGKVFEYTSVRDAAICLKVSHRAIRRYASGLRKSKILTFGFEIEYI